MNLRVSRTGMALWLVAASVIMFVMQAVDNAHILSMVSLSRQYAQAGGPEELFQTLAAVVDSVIARRPADIPTLVPKQATKVFLFHNDLPHDADFYDAMFGYGTASTVQSLPLESHQFLYVDVKDPSRKEIGKA